MYILTKDALDISLCHDQIWNEGNYELALGLVSVRSLIINKGSNLIGKDMSSIHGTVVWCLSSGLTNSVEYHIDYAELYRYETNIIHPPLYAGTCQLSPIADGSMAGGEFRANIGGINHYKKHGYKGKLVSPDELMGDINSSADWICIKYKHNRGILHDGDLPHLASPVSTIPEDKRRVILGFNCFTELVGQCCVRAPEHSDAFNRTIKLYQTMALLGQHINSHQGDIDTNSSISCTNSNTSGSSSSSRSKGGISVKDIMKNPGLAKLLVQAAKIKKRKDEQVE